VQTGRIRGGFKKESRELRGRGEITRKKIETGMRKRALPVIFTIFGKTSEVYRQFKSWEASQGGGERVFGIKQEGGEKSV